MNLRSPASRNKEHQASSTGTAVKTSATHARLISRSRVTPRRKQSREGVTGGKSSISNLSQGDRDILLRQRALAEVQQGNYLEAIALFTELIERNPDSATDYNNRGLVYFQGGQWEAALADYNRAIELNPRLDSVYNNRANYHASQGDLLEAILDYDTALDLNPGNIRAWINQGITFRDLKMYEQAVECFDLALCMGHQLEGHIYAERGRTYHLWGDWNCAIADYNRAIEALAQPKQATTGLAARLRLQVNVWLDELTNP
ncbi:tetratricopeptide repeat protein [Oscillatoria sp. FACHB-1407]|uniref:tetratricopeptide repeat protein n=1 Tax=Oscillatoria sp. FACHB-1407 TaxID=2692847 RepID=UPI0016859985|nr:tetratricopeptide repeat protein [Oscillatoria sp. FACHB-1407]MBD2460270.1 tetratricopeptide repeat protein [Oscillatoria sp. FACHB-1407]